MIDVVLTATLGGLGDLFACLTLGADEQHPTTAGDHIAHRDQGLMEHRYGLLQIDDMSAVADPEQIGLHLRVPTSGAVPEVNAGLQELAHGKRGKCHRIRSFSGSASAG